MSVTRFQHIFPDGMLGTAIISDDELFRYGLSRIWDGSKPLALVVMLNPSKATHKDRDATIAKLIGFGKALGWGGFIVVNLWAYRATEPKDLKAANFPVGPENDFYLETAISLCSGPVICAWGSNPRSMKQMGRVEEVMTIIRRHDRVAQAWRVGAKGDPWHPLYLPYDTPLVSMP